ncbi:esterase/lipase family protein [Nocardioides sp.]|uniref:esterase/lipase family protein n=1 Tax=Nocardioides sp. TaxID=35761 RepID=UPI003511B638
MRPPGRPLLALLALLCGLVVLTAPTAPAGASGATAAARAAERGILPPLPTAPEGDVPGVNDWTCTPSPARPVPVITVHGTIGDRRHLLERLQLALVDAGYCVFSLDYGNRGLEDVVASARQLKAYVARVRTATGAAKVSLIGHSQGGMMPRWYLKFLGGTAFVDDLIGIAPSNHGTLLTGSASPLTPLLAPICPACVQQGSDAALLKRLNAGDETPGDVSYTQITTRYDEVVVPHTSGYLAGGANTRNLTLQRLCPTELAEHLLIPLATPTISLALKALATPGPVPAGFRPRCF